jgi:hypothetical protein
VENKHGRWVTPVIPALKRQENFELEDSLVYIERICLKTVRVGM